MLGDSECTFTRKRRMGGWSTGAILVACTHTRPKGGCLAPRTHGRKVGVWLRLTPSVERLECSTGLRDWSNLYSKGAHVIRSTHSPATPGARTARKVLRLAHYLARRNSMMLTVLKGRPP